MPKQQQPKRENPTDASSAEQTGSTNPMDSPVETLGQLAERPVSFYPPRRRMLNAGAGAAVGVGLGLHRLSAHAAKSPDKMRPQPGDAIVHRFGDRKGQPVKPEDVPEGNLLLEAVTKDPESGVIRDGSRLNGMNLVRIDEKALDKDTSRYAVSGVICYSSVCTHQGCDLTQWVPETTTFKCYCHYSEFDATHMGKPRHGPAKRRLAVLPMELNDAGELVASAAFVGKVGFKKK